MHTQAMTLGSAEEPGRIGTGSRLALLFGVTGSLMIAFLFSPSMSGGLLLLAYAAVALFLLAVFLCAFSNFERALGWSFLYFPIQLSFSVSQTLNVQTGFLLVLVLFSAWCLRRGELRRLHFDAVAKTLTAILVLYACAFLIRGGQLQDLKKPAYTLLFLLLYLLVSSNLRDPNAASRVWKTVRSATWMVLLLGMFLFLLQFLLDQDTYRDLLVEQVVPVFLGRRVSEVFEFFWNAQLDGFVRGMSTFFSPQDYSYYLGIVIPLLLAEALFRRRNARANARVLLLGLAFLALVSTFVRASWVAVILVSAYLLVAAWRQSSGVLLPKHVKIGLAALCLVLVMAVWNTEALMARAVSVFDLSDPSNLHRLATWARAVQNIKENPILGTSQIEFSAEEIQISGQEAIDVTGSVGSHNTYLDFGQDLGIGGVLLSLVLLVALFRSTRPVRFCAHPWIRSMGWGFSGVVLWFGIHNLFDNMFFSPKPALCFWFIAGVVSALPKIDEQLQKKHAARMNHAGQ